MFGKNKIRERHGDLLRWAKSNMAQGDYEQLVASKDSNREAYDNAIANLKRLRAEMEGATNNQQQQPKEAPRKSRNRKKNKGTSFTSQKDIKEKEIKNNIAVLRKKHREYTKSIVPLEVAYEKEEHKLNNMSNDIKKASAKVIGLENREEEMLERAKYVCKTYPKTLMKAKKLLDACVNANEKLEIQREYDAMVKELSEQRELKTKLDGKLAKLWEGSKVIISTLFTGSSNKTILQEIKLSAGGY